MAGYQQKVRWMFIFFLVFGLIHSGHSKPSQSPKLEEEDKEEDLNNDEEYFNDDENDYEDDGNTDNQVQTNEAVPPPEIGNPPYFDISYIEHEVKAGEDVTLFCDVKNLRDPFIVMWFNGTQLFKQGKYLVGSPQVIPLENNAVKIVNAQPYHSNEYSCAIIPGNKTLRIRLEVTSAPRLAVISNERDLTNRSITFRQGDRVEFKCKAYDLENVKIKWSLNGKRVDKSYIHENGKIIIGDVDAHNAGTYQCLGDDNSQRPLHASVTLNVHYAPKVSTHRHHVNTNEGDTAELYCHYRADPIATTKWIKDDNIIPITEILKYRHEEKTEEHRNKTILYISDVRKEDLGKYDCEVQNSIGISSARIYLSYTPETPQIENVEVNGNRVTLEWLVRSKQALVDAVLDYKINTTHIWMTEYVVRSAKSAGNHGIWKLKHELELQPGLWHARVKIQNTEGWSKFSPQHDFVVPQEDTSSDPPQDVIYTADITGTAGSNSGNSKNMINFSVPLTILSSYLLFTLSYLVPSFRIL